MPAHRIRKKGGAKQKVKARAAAASRQGPRQTRQRLEHLYEVSKLFAGSTNAEQPFDPALSIVAKSLPLRSAILIEVDHDRPRMIVWPSEGHDPAQLVAIKAHAERAYAYLTGKPDEVLDEEQGTSDLPRQPGPQLGLDHRFIVIPLVVAHTHSLGCFSSKGRGRSTSRIWRSSTRSPTSSRSRSTGIARGGPRSCGASRQRMRDCVRRPGASRPNATASSPTANAMSTRRWPKRTPASTSRRSRQFRCGSRSSRSSRTI